jgi:hypothetical protein
VSAHTFLRENCFAENSRRISVFFPLAKAHRQRFRRLFAGHARLLAYACTVLALGDALMQLRPATRAEKLENVVIVVLGGAYSLAFVALVGWWFSRTFF